MHALHATTPENHYEAEYIASLVALEFLADLAPLTSEIAKVA